MRSHSSLISCKSAECEQKQMSISELRREVRLQTFNAGTYLIQRQHRDNEALLMLTKPGNILVLHQAEVDKHRAIQDVEETLKLAEMALNGSK